MSIGSDCHRHCWRITKSGCCALHVLPKGGPTGEKGSVDPEAGSFPSSNSTEAIDRLQCVGMAASVTESTDDIWKRICSGLPAQMMDMNDTGSLMKECFPESFSEIFSPIPITDADLTNNNNLADGINSWAPMADSQQYLATLENRLRKLKGMNEEPSSKGMLRSLSQAKKECWDRFLHEQYMSETYSDGYEMDPSAMDYLKRWVQPDRVPVNTEEVQYLISPEGRSETQDEPEG